MPNWCVNQLKIFGPEERRKEFSEYAKGKDFDDETILSFSKFIPPCSSEWNYDWCVVNWGVKWPASDITFRHYKSLSVYDFMTPWGPPNPVIHAMSARFEDLYFKLLYFECGMAFKGVFQCKAGNIMKNMAGLYIGRRLNYFSGCHATNAG